MVLYYYLLYSGNFSVTSLIPAFLKMASSNMLSFMFLQNPFQGAPSPVAKEEERKIQVLVAAFCTIAVLQLARYIVKPISGSTSALFRSLISRFSYDNGGETVQPTESTTIETPRVLTHKQQMLKDTAKRVNAWGQKLRAGATLTKIEGEPEQKSSSVMVKLVRKKLSRTGGFQEILNIGDEEIRFPLAKDDLKVDTEQTNRAVVVGKTKLMFGNLIDRLEFILTLRVLSQQSTKTATQTQAATGS